MISSLVEYSRSSSIALALELIIGLPLIAYMSWRVWEFTISPMLHPREPKQLPYLIPYIGHGLEYVNNGQRLLDRAREYLGDTREPFALMAGGTKLYFLTNSADVASFYKNTADLDFHTIVKPLVKLFGMSDEGIEVAYTVPASLEEDPVRNAIRPSNTKPKSVMQHTSDFEHENLLPGPQNLILESVLEKSLRNTLSKTEFDHYFTISQPNDDKSAVVSLFRWTNMALMTAVPDTIFGPHLARDNLTLLKAFDTFSKYNWKLWYGWKDADNVRKAKDEYVAEIRKFLSIPRSEREPEESELWRQMETAYTVTGMPEEDVVQRAGLLFWVSNSNPSRLTFWILNFLLFRPSLFTKVKTELNAAMPTASSPIDIQKLTDSSPYLNAVIEETLRITIEGASVRIVDNPAGLEIGGKLIPYGARVFSPHRQLHMDEKIWPDAKSFQPERWLAKHVVGKKDSYKPWGGGVTLCPGRFLAKSSIRLFLAIANANFEIELEGGEGGGQEEARFKNDEPVQGPVYPADGMDLRVRLKRK